MSNKQLLLEFEKKIIFMKDVMDGKYNTINKNNTYSKKKTYKSAFETYIIIFIREIYKDAIENDTYKETEVLNNLLSIFRKHKIGLKYESIRQSKHTGFMIMYDENYNESETKKYLHILVNRAPKQLLNKKMLNFLRSNAILVPHLNKLAKWKNRKSTERPIYENEIPTTYENYEEIFNFNTPSSTHIKNLTY